MATVNSRLGAFTAGMEISVNPATFFSLSGAVTFVFAMVNADATTACVLAVEESDGSPNCTPFAPGL